MIRKMLKLKIALPKIILLNFRASSQRPPISKLSKIPILGKMYSFPGSSYGQPPGLGGFPPGQAPPPGMGGEIEKALYLVELADKVS